MASSKYSPRRTSIPDPLPRHEVRAALAARVSSWTCDDLAALPDDDLAAVASCGDGAVRPLALAVWHARVRRTVEVA
jgi:hypothetical protein